MTIDEVLDGMKLACYERVLVATRYKMTLIPLGGGCQPIISLKFGRLEVIETNVTENGNIRFIVPFEKDYLV